MARRCRLGDTRNRWRSGVLNEAHDRRHSEVVYWNLLAEQVIERNDEITDENVEKFLTSLRRDLEHDNLLEGNRYFHELLSKGRHSHIRRGRKRDNLL
ncbi:hypothetical protein [Natrialba sp. INN-245]|uniref:hypothetical protein n=1 Tax=Natrialba sp. INN-245 TaxID=2690967 RepID=UPI00135A938E|nr:hypothetical protein [Natrialba sp. INN-245]